MYRSSCKVSDLSRRCWDGYFRGGWETLRSILYISLPFTRLSYYFILHIVWTFWRCMKYIEYRQDWTSIIFNMACRTWKNCARGTQPLLARRHSQQMLMMVTTALLWARWGVADTVVRCWKSRKNMHIKDYKSANMCKSEVWRITKQGDEPRLHTHRAQAGYYGLQQCSVLVLHMSPCARTHTHTSTVLVVVQTSTDMCRMCPCTVRYIVHSLTFCKHIHTSLHQCGMAQKLAAFNTVHNVYAWDWATACWSHLNL